MPRGHGKVDIKLARCYGSYVLIYGLGFLTDVIIFQILVKQWEWDVKVWTHRVESFFGFFFS